jgi:2-(1,2-epoxy-1,2-dihydrophenyl)acetyl-CoA isomerase
VADVEWRVDGDVGIVTLNRPPHNFMDADLISDVVTAIESLTGECLAVVLNAEGRNFCAGADITKRESSTFSRTGRHLYDHALDLFRQSLPVIAAVQGKAVGGGLGLALTADLRVGTPSTKFIANFSAIGIHPGFGISATLPALVGLSRATDMLTTSRQVAGEEALGWGLLDRLVEQDPLEEALAVARSIAAAPSNAVASVRRTLRRGLVASLVDAMAHERAEQEALIAVRFGAEPSR